MTMKRIAWPLLALMLLAVPASAQLAQASASSLGLGFNNTASARGFAAIANNPAGLGHAETGSFSLAIPAVTGVAGVEPITLAEMAMYEGVRLPDAVRDDWLTRVNTADGQSGSIDLGVTPFAVQFGSIGFQLSTVAAVAANFSADAIELYLYGNAGRTGAAEDFNLDDSMLDGFALTTGAVSFGTKVAPGIHAGATAKYTVGHGLVMGRSQGTTFTSDPLEVQVDFPMIIPGDENAGLNNGSGFGLDVGVVIDQPGVTIGATIQNIVNTFEWSPDGLRYVPGQALFNIDGGDADFDERPALEAPAMLLDELAEATIKPVFSAGVQLRPNSTLMLTADLRKRVEGGMALGPSFHAGIGAEVGVLPFLPLRGHLAKVSGGIQVGGGASLVLGPINVTGAGALRTSTDQNSVLGAVTISFGAN